MSARIGFYVHHEGLGHLRRTAAIIGALDRPATVLTSLPVESGQISSDVEVVTLPLDDGPGLTDRDPRAGGALHWAPLAPDVLGPRVALMVERLTSSDIAVLVCDVSVEAALLARLCGVAPLVVRQNGDRTDDAHTLAHRIAHGILAPFPEPLEARTTPSWVREKSFYGGFITAGSDAGPSTERARRALALGDRPTLLVLLGAGDHRFRIDSLDDAERELEGWQIVLAGPVPHRSPSCSVRVDGWVDDLRDHLAAADVVMATAGSNIVADVALAAKPLICVPEARAFDEQLQRAERLAELGAAVTVPRWPGPGEWHGLVTEALSLGSVRLGGLATGASPEPTARWITEMADAAIGAPRRTASR